MTTQIDVTIIEKVEPHDIIVSCSFTKPSVFDNPKWVTAKETNLEIGLIEGKDYKVSKIEEDRYWVINEYQFNTPVWYYKGKFDTITADDVLQNVFPFEKEDFVKKEPTPCEEVGTDSFEDLVYVEPKKDGVGILYKNLTEQQKNFLLENLNFNKKYGHNEEDSTYIDYDSDCKQWFTEFTGSPSDEISFNDIFVHKTLNMEEL